jgi:hypothetical protein
LPCTARVSSGRIAFDPDRDLDVWPGLAKPPDQQLQERATVLVGVAFAPVEVGRYRFVTAECIHGHVAIVVATAVEEPSFLLAVHGIIQRREERSERVEFQSVSGLHEDVLS